jgi:hypothetical protein
MLAVVRVDAKGGQANARRRRPSNCCRLDPPLEEEHHPLFRKACLRDPLLPSQQTSCPKTSDSSLPRKPRVGDPSGKRSISK